MGIRFQCHECQHRLNVKEFLAGKRGKCPKCNTMFRIPAGDQDLSIPLDAESQERSNSETASAPQRSEMAAVSDSPSPATEPPSQPAPSQPAPSDPVAPDPVAPDPVASDPVASDPAASEPAASQPVESQPTASESSAPPRVTADPISPLDSDSDVVWYVRPPSGGQYGPAGSTLLQQWIQEHRVVPGSLVWRDGWAQWQAAEDVFGPDFGSSGNVDIDLNANLPDLAAGTQGAASASGSVAAVERPRQPVLTQFERRQLARRKKRTRMIAMLAGISLFLVVVIVLVVVSKSGTVEPSG